MQGKRANGRKRKGQSERTKQETKRQSKRWNMFSGQKGQHFSGTSWHLYILSQNQITVIHISRPMKVERSAGGRKEDKTGALRVPERSSSCVCLSEAF